MHICIQNNMRILLIAPFLPSVVSGYDFSPARSCDDMSMSNALCVASSTYNGPNCSVFSDGGYGDSDCYDFQASRRRCDSLTTCQNDGVDTSTGLINCALVNGNCVVDPAYQQVTVRPSDLLFKFIDALQDAGVTSINRYFVSSGGCNKPFPEIDENGHTILRSRTSTETCFNLYEFHNDQICSQDKMNMDRFQTYINNTYQMVTSTILNGQEKVDLFLDALTNVATNFPQFSDILQGFADEDGEDTTNGITIQSILDGIENVRTEIRNNPEFVTLQQDILRWELDQQPRIAPIILGALCAIKLPLERLGLFSTGAPLALQPFIPLYDEIFEYMDCSQMCSATAQESSDDGDDDDGLELWKKWAIGLGVPFAVVLVVLGVGLLTKRITFSTKGGFKLVNSHFPM